MLFSFDFHQTRWIEVALVLRSRWSFLHSL